MRIVIFRGYNKKSDKWLYGSRVMMDGRLYVLPDSFDGKSWDDYEVEHNSVGMYTGLRDVNGNGIYEGDIVVHPYIDPIFGDLVENSRVYSVVVFHDGAFTVEYGENRFAYLDAIVRNAKIEVRRADGDGRCEDRLHT